MSNPANVCRRSPLPFSSSRASPFRRPESTLPSPPVIPGSSGTSGSATGKPTAAATSLSPERLSSSVPRSGSASPALSRRHDSGSTSAAGGRPPWVSARPASPLLHSDSDSDRTTRGLSPMGNPDRGQHSHRLPGLPRPCEEPAEAENPDSNYSSGNMPIANDPLACLPLPLLRTMRESFAVLDRSNSGVVTASDVADMLSQLGVSDPSSMIPSYFPSPNSTIITLPSYLMALSTSLSQMSPSNELLAAFAAFDTDDSGKVDLAELRHSLMNTPPEPGTSALRAAEVEAVLSEFKGRGSLSDKRGFVGGDVFHYRDFIDTVDGGKEETQLQN